MTGTIEPPHRVVGRILNSILEVPKTVSESISSSLDRGPLGSRGPHRIIDSLVKSISSSIQTLGEGISSALDKPIEGIARG